MLAQIAELRGAFDQARAQLDDSRVGDNSAHTSSIQEARMNALKGTKTHDNLKAAFAGESQANRRYLYFASKADVEGQNDVAALFRSTAEG